jgi:maltose O-acetyltransferase
VKALRTIGWRRTLRYAAVTVAMAPFGLLLFPPLRTLWLRALGARVGRGVVLHRVRFFNLDRRGLPGLSLGDDVFVGDECLLDVAESVVLERQVTLAERVLVLTHTNVGYPDHPLQAHLPARAASVTIREASFVGAGATILPGLTIGPGAVVGAGSVVTDDVPPWTVVAGVPARPLRSLRR